MTKSELEVKAIECQKLEGEIVTLRKDLENFKIQLEKNQKFE